jgi:DNA-binding NarL/FixJ family response regulator
MSTATRIMIVDDHEVVREGVRGIFTRDPRYEVVGMAGDGAGAIAAVAAARPDVVLVDMRLPDMPGEDVCRAIRELQPSAHVIMLTTYVSEEAVRAALLAGASAYVTKAAGLHDLRRVIAEVTHTDAGATTPARQHQIRALLHDLIDERGARSSAAATAATPQQLRVLELLAQGLTNRLIAKQLFLSESTVRFHVQNLKQKIGARTRTELVLRAIEDGMIEPVRRSDPTR